MNGCRRDEAVIGTLLLKTDDIKKAAWRLNRALTEFFGIYLNNNM